MPERQRAETVAVQNHAGAMYDEVDDVMMMR